MKEIMIPYILIIWLLVKFGVIKWNMKSGFWSVAIGVFLSFMLFTSHRFYSPADLSNSTTVKAPHAVLSPAFLQEIDNVYVNHNQEVKKGELIYTLVDVDSQGKIDSIDAKIFANQQSILSLETKMSNNQLNFQRQTELDQFSSQKERDDLGAEVEQNEADIAKLHADISALQADKDVAVWESSRREIRAPFDGQISIVNIAKGTRVGNMQIYDTSKKFVEMRIPDQAYNYIEVGQFAEFYVDAYPGHVFRGKVHSLTTGTGEAQVRRLAGEQQVRQHVGQNMGSHGRTIVLEFEEPEGMTVPIGATGAGWVSATKPHPLFGFIDIIGAATVRLTSMKAYLNAL
ncbi:hypothetical protein SIN8267_00816 [Sinobacterium norvegicum]|uniref:Hemolysin D n=1 Tax=Sinobacterium norvegicum TaxID=1641715 RepID=A0ABM9ABZ4_9GAMM|nr:HlyD family efflux transporter periplasmic adaptor subunit [Sinobacterium norvegicum]CAH0990721.1 hypothetical protein SIN8267_00816 [Sinobacterium norvegicum]